MKIEAQDRFRDGPTWLEEFQDEILVICPRCSGDAVASRGDKRRFVCSGCAYVAEDYVGPMVGTSRRRCGDCGKWLTGKLESGADGPRPAETQLACSTCTRTTAAPVSWSPINDGAPRDPLSGAKLRLTTNAAGRVLWVYNSAHARFLLSFVEAQLRERTPNRNSSLASRLPKWMQSAKNRPAVASALRILIARSGGDDSLSANRE